MKNPMTQRISLTALFVALGLLLPMLFHGMGLGSTFLPMFWPIATGAFFLPLPYALLLGVATPFLSALLTGMPPFSPPVVYIMMAELAALTITIALLYEYGRWGYFWILLTALIVSRFVLVYLVRLLAPRLGLPPKWFSLAAVVQGLPGMIVMLIFIPTLVSRLQNKKFIRHR